MLNPKIGEIIQYNLRIEYVQNGLVQPLKKQTAIIVHQLFYSSNQRQLPQKFFSRNLEQKWVEMGEIYRCGCVRNQEIQKLHLGPLADDCE